MTSSPLQPKLYLNAMGDYRNGALNQKTIMSLEFMATTAALGVDSLQEACSEGST